MDVKYDFPGLIEIGLDLRDLEDLQRQGYCMDRAGFSGIESKTWIHLPSIEAGMGRSALDNNADIEDGGDLHVHLIRGFLPPVTIEQAQISANAGLVEHYLGRSGIIKVTKIFLFITGDEIWRINI